MLTFSVDKDFIPHIVDGGVGSFTRTFNRGDISIFEGFDGENTITIHLSGMQDGTWSVAIVFTMVDNPLVVKTGSIKIPFSEPEGHNVLAGFLNSIVVSEEEDREAEF